jgi:hypothetical protein
MAKNYPALQRPATSKNARLTPVSGAALFEQGWFAREIHNGSAICHSSLLGGNARLGGDAGSGSAENSQTVQRRMDGQQGDHSSERKNQEGLRCGMPRAGHGGPDRGAQARHDGCSQAAENRGPEPGSERKDREAM